MEPGCAVVFVGSPCPDQGNPRSSETFVSCTGRRPGRGGVHRDPFVASPQRHDIEGGWRGGGGVAGHLGLTETQRGRLWTACGQRSVWTAKTVKRPRQQPTQPPIRQLLGAADAQTAHPATSSTAPTHQTTGLRERGNDTSGSTGRSGRRNAATRRNMRREERVTVQGPVKKQQPNGMSHGGGGGMAMILTSGAGGGEGSGRRQRHPGGGG